MIKVFDSFEGMQLFENESEQAWIRDGLALQIKLLEERGEDTVETTAPDADEEIYFLYPEVTAIDRARDCADEFGKCSIEEMQDLIPSKCSPRKKTLFLWFRVSQKLTFYVRWNSPGTTPLECHSQ